MDKRFSWYVPYTIGAAFTLGLLFGTSSEASLKELTARPWYELIFGGLVVWAVWPFILGLCVAFTLKAAKLA